MGIHYLAVLLAGVAAMVVGGLWYSPLLFSKAWMNEVGLSQGQLEELKKKGMAKTYTLALAMCLLTSWCFAFLAGKVRIVHPDGAIKLAVLIWTGFVLPAVFSPVLWQGKSLKLFAINGGYYLTILSVIGLILVAL